MALSDLIPGVSEAKAIVGGIMVTGVVGLGLWGARVDHLRAKHLAEAQALNIALHNESAANQTTTASLTLCMSTVDQLNAQTERRAKSLADATAGYEADLAKLKQDSAAQADKLAYWQGMAEKFQAQAKCPISAELAKELNR